MAEHFDLVHLSQSLAAAVDEAGSPELINHGIGTHPKARLRKLLGGRYKETADGPIVLGKIGLDAIRAACPHFSAWLQKLESLEQVE